MVAAADDLIRAVNSSEILDQAFRGGKMLGILICRRTNPSGNGLHNEQSSATLPPDSQPNSTQSDDTQSRSTQSDDTQSKTVLYAYSGKKLPDEGTLTFPDGHKGAFVPPIYDTTQGHFRKVEAEISQINARIEHLEQCLKDNDGTHTTYDCDREIERLKADRAEKSVELQKWTFRQYKVLNGFGKTKDIENIFGESGLTPPAATGDCAAPKLLQYAYSHHLDPLEIGEFWYGKSPEGPVREQGRFYPACSWKCGPLLRYMTTGLDLEDESVSYIKAGSHTLQFHTPKYHSPESNMPESNTLRPLIVYEDKHIIVADKPSSMPSVPGLDGRKSLLEIIHEHYPERTVFEVHRLDQDTSGLIVYAFSRKNQSALRKQFENREVIKRYIAVVDGIPQIMTEKDCTNSKATGTISLPLAPDYEDKPRQKVSFQQGKEAVTEYRVIGESSSVNCCATNCYTIVEFTPRTGRTHQLRVHAAHFKGLGCPIAGDTLYGSGSAAARLCLHASYLSFNHPEDGRKLEFHSAPDFI